MADIGVHTLRHSAAVAWMESGVHIKAVADLLGHSSIAVTGDVYGHTSDTTARAAVDGCPISSAYWTSELRCYPRCYPRTFCSNKGGSRFLRNRL